ncbi:discoidin domain-containing protein [Paenibacillus sp. MER TA 81-3]|uniref:discoidin domain-containing protein n=1 Tax=Paenibacillus sp. MER TA 81-3 TaxID=2939573 RepID=UPI002040C81D|nr:discoidin domain-containing protein [Paenibacillus sp. MER TA 81-3]MCM3338028.1 discoidin domain-containing protein [Paenibacillus sp. MER TA 81-3]
MKKTIQLKAISLLLSLMVAMTTTLTFAQPMTALANSSVQDAAEDAASRQEDTPPAVAVPDVQDGPPPSVTDAVYDKDGNMLPSDSPDDASAAFSGTNLALNKPVFASGNEVDYLNPELAVDGKPNTRWSSAKQDDQWFYVDLGERKAVDRVVIRWQTRADTYKILVSDDGVQWSNVKDNDGMIQCNGGIEIIDFTPRQARYVKFQGVKRAPVDGILYGYSFYEFEVYQLNDLQSIVDKIAATLTVHAGQTKLDWSAAEVPKGYRVGVYGSDRLPVIDREGNIRTPLVDAKVNLLVQVEDVNDSNRKLLSGNIAVTVPGQYKQTSERNAEPDVIPSLREWYGGSGNYTLTESSRIVVNPQDESALRKAAELTREDLLDLTGYELEIVYGQPQRGDLYLLIDPSLTWLGEEGNVFEAGEYVSITSVSAKGAFFGTRTALQIIKQNKDRTIPQGEARDYPKYEKRGLMIDVARKFYTINFLRSYVKLMSWYKMNMFQIHLNDDVGTPFADGTTAAYRLESTTYPGLASPNGYYTKQEFKDLQLLGMDYGVNVIPEIDTPGHSRAFTSYDPALGNERSLDISKPETVAFVKKLFDEYLDGSDPTFVGPEVHIGTDEYWGPDVEIFRRYMDTLVKHINGKGKHPHLWGGLTEYNGSAPVSNEATMDIWYEPYGAPQQAVDLGFDVLNVQNVFLYIVPTLYGEYLNSQFLYNEWEPIKWETATLPFGHPRVKGGMFALWNDVSDANGLSMDDSHERLLPGIQVVSEKMWTGTRDDKSFERYVKRAEAIGDAPNANLSHKIVVDNEENRVIQYLFEDQFKDQSGNGFDGEGVNVEMTEGKYDKGVRLNGGKSYIETPIVALGFGWTLSMWVKPDKNNPDDAVLMESPAGKLKLKQGKTGKLGFTKEHYDSTFNYVVPEDKWTHIFLRGDSKGVTLFVNVDEYVERLENTYPHLQTLVLPTLKIGSDTNAFKGVLDNVMIYNKPIELLSSDNVALHKATESSATEFPYYSSDMAVDGVVSISSRWSSAYVDDAWFMVDLGESKEINKVIIKWQAGAEKYQLLVSDDKQNWTNVSGDGGVITSKGNLDIITFDPKVARYVKFQGVKRATVFGYSFFEFEVYQPDEVKEYQQAIKEMEEALLKYNGSSRLRALLLQVLNRYPNDATRPVQPIKDLIQQWKDSVVPGNNGGGGHGGSGSTGGSSGGGVTSTAPAVEKEGQLTLKAGQSGTFGIGNQFSISIPAGATDEELRLTLRQVSNPSSVVSDKAMLASEVYEALYDGRAFAKPVAVTMAFDAGKLGPAHKASLFQYDEANKAWSEAGGSVSGHFITAEVKKLGIFAVFAVADDTDDADDVAAYTDISGHWAEQGIRAAARKGIVGGYPDGSFQPDVAVTRAEFIVMLARAMHWQNDGVELKYKDAASIGAWSSKAIAQAVEAGIVNGFADGTFRPNASIKRQEMTVIIARALKLSAENEAATAFADDRDIPEWARGAVAAAVKVGIVGGRGSGKFAPHETATRAESAAVMIKAAER